MAEIIEGAPAEWALPPPGPRSRFARLVGWVLPLIVVIAAVGASGFFVVTAVRAGDEAWRVREDTDRLTGLAARADSRSDRAERLAERLDEDAAVVVATAPDVGGAHDDVVSEQHDQVDAADAAIDQLNAGAISAGKDAFRTVVNAAIDRHELALAVLVGEIDTFSDVITALDATIEARP